MAKKKKKKDLGTSSARQEKVALKQAQKKSTTTSSAPKTNYSSMNKSTAVKKTANVEQKIQTRTNADVKRKNNPKRSVVKPNNPISNSSASRVSQANKFLKENKSALSSKDYYSLKRDINKAAKRNVGNWDGMKMITQGGFTKKEQEKLKKTREKQGRKAIGDADYNAKGEGNRGSAAKTTKKKTTGTEKLKKSPGWDMTQEERFLKQRQYQRTQADKSADQLVSKAANAKDAAETEVSVFKNYGKHAEAATRHAKENVEKYKKTGDAKYLEEAKKEVDLGKVFQKRQQDKVSDINRTQEEYSFHQTNLNYDKYLKDTNPEYKMQSKLNESDKSNKDKRKSAEDWAEKNYKDKFGDLSDNLSKQSLKDEAERLAGLENPTEVQQAEIRVLRDYYNRLPAAEKDRRIQDALYAKSGTTLSRITQSVGAGAEEALAGIMRLPQVLDDTTTEVMDKLGIDDDPRTENARRAEAGYSKFLEWMDEKADKLEAKSEQHRANAARNTSGLGKAAVDLGIVATQIAGDMAAGGPARALLSMGARVAGSTYNEAKERGADTGEALAYMGLQTGKELLTEKIFGAALPFYGKGLASDSVEKMVSKAIDKAATRASSKAGERAVKSFLTSVANFAGEGAEEGISGVFDPIVSAITIGDKEDLKQYGKQEFWDDVAYQVVLGGAAGFLGGSMEIARNKAPGVDEETRAELKEKRATREQQRALESFVPNRMSEFSQGLVNTGIKTSTAVNTDGVLRKLEDGDPVNDKDIRDTIKKLNPKKESGKRAIDAIGNRFGIDNLSSMEKEEDIVKAIRDGATAVKANKDAAVDGVVQSAEAEQQAAEDQARMEEAEREMNTTPLTERKIMVEGLGEVDFDTFREELLKFNPDVNEDQIMQGWSTAVQMNGIEPENTDALDAISEPAPQIEGQMDLFGEMGRTDEEEAKFLEDTFGIKRGEDGQMNMFDAMDDDTIKEQVFGIKKEEPYDEMRELAEQGERRRNSVLTRNEAASALPQETQDDLNTLAGNIGYRVEVHDHIDAPEGAADVDTDNAIINGYIDRDTNTLHLAMDATDDIETTRSRIMKVVGLHETTHALETLAEPEYMEYSNYVEKHYADLTGMDFTTALNNRIEQYAKANVQLDEDTARRELMAEYASRMDQDTVFDFVNSNPTIGQKIVDMWKSIVAKLREAFGMSGDAGEALRKWETAYRAATARTIRAQDTQAVRDSANSNVEIVDNNGEFIASNDGNGHMMFSVSTLGLSEDETTFTGPGGQVVEGWIADQEDLSAESKKALKDGLIAIYKTVKPIADSGEFEPFTSWSEAAVRLDNEGNPIISVVTPNDEYEMNLDHGSVCVKRQTLDAVIEELVRRGSFNDFKMDGPDIVEINRIIGENNFDVTCSICFVEQRRYRQVKLAEEFSDMYNEFVRGMMPEGTDATYFNYGGNQRLDEHNATIANDVSQLPDEDLALDTKYTVERSEKDENGKTKTVNREMTLQELKDEKNDNGGLRQGVDNKIARYLLASPEARHLLDRGDFAYAGAFDNAKENSPKVKLQEGTDTITDIESLFVAKGGAGRPLPSHNPTQYLHEMLADEDKFDVEEAFRIGGVRRQSASDFIPHMFFDYAEEVFDLEARGLPEHTYAKVPSYVWLFGLTGEKMNMSFIPAIDEDGVAPGLDADGNYVWLDGQTFPEEEAYKIADTPGYTKNCGPTAVGASDPHIEKMLDDDKISMIIPYHKSNANPVVAAMNGTSYMVDYTGYQNTRHQDGTKLSASEAKKVPNYNELLRQYEADDNDAPKKAAEDYVRWCEDNNYLPKFDQFAYAKDENGDYIVNEDGRLAVRDGYYKVLTDFKLYDKDGNYCPQEAVKQRYPDNLEEILRDALKGETELEENRKAKVSAITDTVENVLRNDLRQKALSAKEVAADKARVKALNDENTARYKAEQEKRRAALQSRAQNTTPRSGGAVQYSLTPVPPVQNTSDAWRPGATFDEVKAAHPNLYDTEGTEEEVSNKTQIQGTRKTYDKVFQALMGEDFDGSILDASSGLGLGTELGKEYGLNIEDIEPYPNIEKHTPDYTDYSTLNKKYDFIISNAVLNVVPQDQRDALVVKMGELLNDGGRMFINVRGKDVLNSSNKEAINEDLMEYYIPGSRSYQKGFTRQELKAYLEDALGDGYRVETDMGAFKTSGVPVLVYKEGTTAQYSLGSPRTSNSVLGQNNTVPTEEEIKSGSATYGGLPIIYHPEMKADARNMDTEVWVSDKFFNDPDQQHILNHEVAHNLSDELMSMHTGDWQEFASNFIEEKQTPPSSSAYANGNRTYWEGLYGDIGATALSETTTQAISEYLDDPERLRQRSEDAYEVIDNFMRSREDNTQFSISENQNDKTSEALRRMYESLGLSPHAQPMELRPNAKPQQSKVNANTFTNTGIFELATEEIEDDELKTRAKNAGKQVKERGKYDRVSEQESMATAKTRLETDYEGEKRKLSDETREWTGVDLDTAMGIASSELAKGNIDEFDKWTDIIQRMGTRAGQLIQAFAKYSRTPEGVAVQAKKALDELGKVNPEKKAELKETVNRLTKQLQAIQKGDLNALIDQFLEQAKIRNTKVNEKKVRREFANATWQRDYNRVVTQLLAIPTDYIKASKGQKVATYQTLSHLLNLRTNNRNILSNFVFGEVETLANDLATIPDFFIGLATGKRTVGLEGPGLAPKALKAGWERGRQTALDVRADIMPLDSDTKYGTTRRTWKKASSNPLERGMSNLEMILGYELNVTDEFAKGQHETRIRKGLQKWVDKGMYSEEVMDQFAEQEMLYRTFQDDTFLGTVLAGIKNHLNVVGFGHTGRYLKGNKYEIKEFGLGDLVQKYTTVPGALGTRVVEYSPVGYMKMFYNMAQLHEAQKNLKTEMAKEKPGDKRLASIETDLLNYQRALALSMSRATTGSGLVIGLYLLKGLIKSTPDSGDDDDEKNAAAIRTLQGLSGTQINISALGRLIKREDNAIDWRDGDTLYDLTFLEPMNGLMDISAQMVQDEDVDSLKDEDFWKDLFGNSLESIYETFMDLPTMQQLNSIQMELRYHDDDMMKTIPTIGLELMKGSATGFVPAPIRQMAQARDEYYRETYQSQDLVDNTRDALMNSIPGLREKLPTKQDSYGRDKEQEFLRRRALNAFVNPGKTSTYKVSPLEKEIADIASSTDNEYKLYPDRKAPKKLSFGSKKELTNAEKRKYMQILGGAYTSEMNDLIQSEDYKEASASEKEKMMLDRRTFADMEAKAKLAEAFKTTYSKTSTVDKVLAHRDMGYSDKQWAELEKGMTDPKSDSINQDTAKPYLDSITLDDDPVKDRQKKAEIWRAMGWQDYSKNGKKLNPYL